MSYKSAIKTKDINCHYLSPLKEDVPNESVIKTEIKKKIPTANLQTQNHTQKYKNRFTKENESFFMHDWDSISRQQRALTQNIQIIKEVDNLVNIVQIKGTQGEIYTTSLESCSCPDFYDQDNNLIQINLQYQNIIPCKHMYFLADKLGVFNLKWGLLSTAENIETFEKLENISITSLKILRKFINSYQNEFLIKKSSEVMELINKKVFIDKTNPEIIIDKNYIKVELLKDFIGKEQKLEVFFARQNYINNYQQVYIEEN